MAVSPPRTLAAFIIACLSVSVCFADDSFRTEDGKIIERGMTTAQVLKLLGAPDNKFKPSDDIEIDFGGGSVDTWTYELPGSIGGPYLVEITFEGGNVREVEAEQLQ